MICRDSNFRHPDNEIVFVNFWNVFDQYMTIMHDMNLQLWKCIGCDMDALHLKVA